MLLFVENRKCKDADKSKRLRELCTFNSTLNIECLDHIISYQKPTYNDKRNEGDRCQIFEAHHLVVFIRFSFQNEEHTSYD